MVHTNGSSKNVLVKVINSLGDFARATWMPYHSQSIPFKDIAEASTTDRDAQTSEWRAMKLTELNIVSVTGALVAGVVTGALAWPYSKPWTVTGFWICSLVFALFSIVLATQQSVVLTRASTGRNTLANLRVLMSATTIPSTTGNGSVFVPQGLTLFVWQASTMLLGISIMLLLIGLMVFVYEAAKAAGGWGDERKIAIWFTISMVFGMVTYFVSWMKTEWQFQSLLLNEENSRGGF